MKIKKYIIPILATILVASIFFISLFGGKPKEATVSGFAMGSPVNITVYDIKNGEDYCNQALDRIKYIDNNFLSHTISNSAVYKLNNGEMVENTWFAEYLKKCVELDQAYSGFTLFSGEFKSLWKIENGGYVPSDDEIAQVLENHNDSKLIFDDKKVSLNGKNLDLGALGKGTACDEAIGVFKELGIENALVTVGGTVGMIGSPDGKNKFNVGIRNPFGSQNDYFAVLNVTDCFVSTSGDYEKYFEKDGIRYSHIFDAKTASPVQNDLSSVTVVAKNGMISDFLSTLIYIEGVENGFKIAKDFDAEIIIIKKDKTVLVSKGISESLTVQDKNFSVSVIE